MNISVPVKFYLSLTIFICCGVTSPTRADFEYRIINGQIQVKYGDRFYSGPVCSKCSMCSDIVMMINLVKQHLQKQKELNQSVKYISTQFESTGFSSVQVAKAAMKIIRPMKGKTVADFGCGKGIILIEAAKQGSSCVGFDIEPKYLSEAFKKIQKEGLSNLIDLYEYDITLLRNINYDAIYFFQFPDLIEQVYPHIASGTLIVSFEHRLPGSCWSTEQDGFLFYVAIKE